MAARLLQPPIKELGQVSHLILIPSLAHAFTKWLGTKMRRDGCTCKTMEDGVIGTAPGGVARISGFCAAMTMAIRGDRSRKDFHLILAFRSSCIRTTRTRSMFCHWSR